MSEGVGELIDRLTRVVPDWPEPGVVFRDLSPVLAHPDGLAAVVDATVGAVQALGSVDVVAGIESRGFWLAAAVATRLGVGFVPVRKAGKLPGDVLSADYSLEYGTATLEVGAEAVEPGSRVVLMDDVLATGGTLAAGAELVESAGGVPVGASVLIEIGALGGRERLAPLVVDSLRTY